MTSFKTPFRGNDMKALYEKVLKGQYTKIPAMYSKDLATMIRGLLSVNPTYRPSCDQILKMKMVINREHLFSQPLYDPP